MFGFPERRRRVADAMCTCGGDPSNQPAYELCPMHDLHEKNRGRRLGGLAGHKDLQELATRVSRLELLHAPPSGPQTEAAGRIEIDRKIADRDAMLARERGQE